MNVRQLLGKKGIGVLTISPSATVLDAVKVLAEHDIGALMVLDNGNVVGIISERDYARKVILQGKASIDTPVSEIMSRDLISVTSAESVDACMELMTRERVRHLPVIENDQLTGIISIGDVVKNIIERQQNAIEELEHYIQGSR